MKTGHGSGNPSASWKERTSCHGEWQRSSARLRRRARKKTAGTEQKNGWVAFRSAGWMGLSGAAPPWRSRQPVSSQPCVSRPERQVTPPTPAVTRALADNGTISRSMSAPETPCHRPGTCATPARAGEQWMRGSAARSSGCSGAAPAHWHCVDLATLDNGGRS